MAEQLIADRFSVQERPLWTCVAICIVEDSSGPENTSMADHVYKKIELVGSSPDGFDAAVKNALARASETIRNMRWFEVIETRGQIENGQINHWQVTLKVGFTLDK